jgi:putative nucleotidyltransferase with HDIG domain
MSNVQLEMDVTGKLKPDCSVSRESVFERCADLLHMERLLESSLNSLHSTLEESIKIIAGMVEMRDPYTAGHQKRVAYLSREIARDLDLETDTVETIQKAALVHDIGKLYIPAEILNKVGKLTEAEFDRIKLHPQIGYAILSKGGFFRQVDQVVWQHHERMNGSGYPRGLSGDRISLEARILSVADVIDAMAVARPYRPALGISTALDEIVKNSSVLYDGQVVKACLRFFARKGFQPGESPLFAS